MFDADTRAFGAFSVSGPARPGRFGLIFPASGVDGRPVVVRTFTDSLTREQREALSVALATLCDAPLDHPGIVTPLASGMQDGTPFIVHEWVEGEPLDIALGPGGHCRLEDLLAPMTRVAAALDFAAAAGVYHGGLTAGDILLVDEDAAVVGFGLVQALARAGVDVHATNDVASLARILYAAVGEQPFRLEVPPSALALIDRVQKDLHRQTLTTIAAAKEPAPPPDVQYREPSEELQTLQEPHAIAETRSGRRWLPLAFTAALAGMAGFAAGYGVRGTAGAGVAAPPAAAATSGVSEAVRPLGQPPAALGGSPTELPTTPSAAPGARNRPGSTQPGAAARRTDSDLPRGQQPESGGAIRARLGSLQVLSRPSGARVFVDGELAGSTPLVLSNVTSGAHAVRLDLPGHQPWTTRVEVAAGAQVRVAGSLER